MNPGRILLPIELAKCPIEVLDAVSSFARRPELTVILLHVVNLNIVAPERRIYDELCQEARQYLERLAQDYLRQIPNIVIRVRTGEPDEEVLREAAEREVDLIILPSYGPSWWERLTSVWKRQPGSAAARLPNRILRKSGCAVFIVKANTRFNCRKAWGRAVLSPRTNRSYAREHGQGLAG